MAVRLGSRVTMKDGIHHGVVMKPGDPTKILSLATGEIREWALDSYTVDDCQDDIRPVFVVNPQRTPLRTILWAVVIGNLISVVVYSICFGIARGFMAAWDAQHAPPF